MSLDETPENKLYVGNLDRRITEYHVIKMFAPFGKIKKEEYLWHTHGPKKGEPRGYGFVEFSTREEAMKAKERMNGKIAFGRPLVVRFVDEKVSTHNSEAPVRGREGQKLGAGGVGGSSAGGGGGQSKSAKILEIKRKLLAMQRESESKS